MATWYKKLVAGGIVTALMIGGVAFGVPQRVEAQVAGLAAGIAAAQAAATAGSAVAPGLPVTIVSSAPDLGKSISDALLSGLKSAGYTFLKLSFRQAAKFATESALNNLATGALGKRPLFETLPFGEVVTNVGLSSLGAFADGVAIGIDRTYRKPQEQEKAREAAAAANERLSVLNRTEPSCAEASRRTTICKAEASRGPAQFSSEDCATAQVKQLQCAEEMKIVEQSTNFEALFAQQEAARDRNYLQGKSGQITEGAQNIINLVCNPDPNFSLRILIPSLQRQPDQTPVCNIRRAWEDWSTIVRRTGQSLDNADGWSILREMVRPSQGDIGIVFQAQLTQQYQIAQSMRYKEGQLQFEGPISNQRSLSGQTNTPGSTIGDAISSAISNNLNTDKEITGDIVADVTGLVLGTVFDGVLNLLLQDGGLVAAGSGDLYDSKSAVYTGVPAAKRISAKLAVASFNNSASTINVLAELQAACEGKLSLNPNCGVLTAKLANAITKRMTVAEAMRTEVFGPNTGQNENGGGSGIFGYNASGGQPDINSGGLPYRSMVILRKYRVLPISWEIAAQYIKNNPTACGAGGCTLKQLTDEYNNPNYPNSPFKGLIDKNWVLKLPETQCVLRGAGPLFPEPGDAVCRFDTNGDGQICCDTAATCPNPDEKVPQVSRVEMCLDEQSCLTDDKNGECKGDFGYCLEEKRIFSLDGDQCGEAFTSCKVFQDVASGATAGYLTDTLQGLELNVRPGDQVALRESCKAEDAGCQGYATVRSVTSTSPSVVDWASERVQLADRAFSQTNTCSASDEGCRALTDKLTNAAVFLKLPPTELKTECAKPTSQRAAYCAQYTNSCSAEYVGCQTLTPLDGSPTIATKSHEVQSCSASCAGFASLAQTRTQFEAANLTVPILPSSAKTCSLQAAGCTAYTSLAVGTSAESTGYFTHLQACTVKPKLADTDYATRLGTFYSWEGSDVGGTRLVTYYLEKDTSGAPQCAAGYDGQCTCTPGTNGLSDRICKEFFTTSATGVATTYHRYVDNLVYQTDDCQPYRSNVASTEAVRNGSPSLSRTCSASENLCRAYTGSQSGNIQVLLLSTFDANSVEGWTGSGALTPSSEAQTPEEKSLKFSGTIQNDRLHPPALEKEAQHHAGRTVFRVASIPNSYQSIP